MDHMWWLGMLMFAAAGAILWDVPFLRFLSAMLLIACGTLLNVLGKV